jgi:ribonuclease E
MIEILVDSPELFEKTRKHIEQVKPEFIDKIKLYQSKVPLFSFYQIEKQIETAYQRVVRLPSGGSISIDHTEALVSVDVNSSKATGGGTIEETASNTNLEAADEIARQLRLRDIGGLIVIDFIDMSQIKNQREVSHRLRAALEHDRARVQVGHITRFGLLEMSRQRLRSHLGASIQVTCPRCDGQGTIRSIESLASSIIRVIEEEAIKEDTSDIQIQLPIDLATFILNERRDVIVELSKRQGISVTILPNQYLDTPQYKIKRIRINEAFKNKGASYSLIEPQEIKLTEKKEVTTHTSEQPAIVPNVEAVKKSKGIFAGIKNLFGKILKPSKTTEKTSKTSSVAKPTSSIGGLTSSTLPPRRRPQSRSNPKKYRRSGPIDRRNPNRTGTGNRRPISSGSSTLHNTRTQSTQGAKKFTPPPPSDTYHEITAERIKEDVGLNAAPQQQQPQIETQHPQTIAHVPNENVSSNVSNIESKDTKNTEE